MFLGEICLTRQLTVYFLSILSVNFFVQCQIVAEHVVRILPQEQYCEVKV